VFLCLFVNIFLVFYLCFVEEKPCFWFEMSSSRMNRGLLVLLKEEQFAFVLISSGVTLNGVYLQVSPLAVPTTWVTRVASRRMSLGPAHRSRGAD